MDSPPTREQLLERIGLERSIGFLYMYEGSFLEAASWLERALETARDPLVPAAIRQRLRAVLGIIAMRRGEVENCVECVGPSSCIFPIASEAVHRNQAGSREAVKWFTDYLEESPRDLRIIWLLNIAYMTLGEYPDKVPPQYLIPPGLLRSEGDVGRFENVASPGGLTARGPNLAGGSIFDDFNGDGLPDLFTTSLDADLGASLFVNRGDGTFDDRSASAGLGDQVYALNVTRADFDNDGDLDVLLLRGGWERPLRLSLLRNRGDATFDDVTVAAGLGEPIATESAAWGDYDNDGLVDLFVCGEFLPPGVQPTTTLGDPRNRCRLYHNQGDGTFEDVAAKAGVLNERCAKGSAGATTTATAGSTSSSRTWDSRAASTTTRATARSRTSPPELGVTGADYQLRLLVLGLRQRRPARPLRQRLPGPRRRGARQRDGASRSRAPASPGSITTSAPTASATSDRAGARPRHGADGLQLRRHRQRRLPRHLPGDRRHVVRGPGRQPDVQERRGPRLRGRDHAVGDRPPPEGARRLVRRLRRRRRPRPLRRAGRRDARRPGLQRPVPQPGPGPPLAEGQAGRHADQPRGTRGQHPGRHRPRRTAGPGRSTARSATTPASAATASSRRSACSTPPASPS